MAETIAPVTVAISKGIIEASVRSSISTSRANINPAIGALKMPAMAAAAPQPTISIVFLLFNLKALLIFDPMAEPV